METLDQQSDPKNDSSSYRLPWLPPKTERRESLGERIKRFALEKAVRLFRKLRKL